MAYHTTPIHLERRQLDNQLVDKRSGQPLAAFHVSPGVAELPLTDANLHMRRETEDARRGLLENSHQRLPLRFSWRLFIEMGVPQRPHRLG